MQKKILYFDMDNVLVDFQSGIDRLSEETKCEYEGRLDEVPGVFRLMDPVPYAVDTVKFLAEYFDVYILSTAPWKNSSAWTDKANWVHKYFGIEKDSVFHKRLIITHRKDLNRGDFLIDDRTKNGAGEFQGELIQFGSEKFPDWFEVRLHLFNRLLQFAEKEGDSPFADYGNIAPLAWLKGSWENGIILDAKYNESQLKLMKSILEKKYKK